MLSGHISKSVSVCGHVSNVMPSKRPSLRVLRANGISANSAHVQCCCRGEAHVRLKCMVHGASRRLTTASNWTGSRRPLRDTL